MAFKKFTRNASSDDAIILLADGRFVYQGSMVRLASLDENSRVTYHIDEENRKIAFEFHTDKREDDYAIKSPKGNPSIFRSSASDLVRRYSWVSELAKLKVASHKKFLASKEKDFWVIELPPLFERLDYSGDSIESFELNGKERYGVYRLWKNGEVFLIGSGNVYKELCYENSTAGRGVGADKVEFSSLPDEQAQLKWKSHFLRQYEKDHGELPLLNRDQDNSPPRLEDWAKKL